MACFENYKLVLKEISDELRKEACSNSALDIDARINTVIEYNALHYGKARGYLVSEAYCQILQEKVTESGLHQAYVLGWIWQILQTFYTMKDDLYDEDKIRYNKPTWLSLNGKTIADIDAVLLECYAKRVLKRYFKTHPQYEVIRDFLDKTTLEYFSGQSQEVMFAKNFDISRISYPLYDTLAINMCDKYVAGGMPLLALILTGINEKNELWKKVENICKNIARLWKLQDDYGDSFGRAKTEQMEHKDIKQKKLTLLLVKAKELGSSEQLTTLQNCFSELDENDVLKIVEIYKDLKIPEVCTNYMKQLNKKITTDIEALLRTGNQVGLVLQKLQEFYNNISE